MITPRERCNLYCASSQPELRMATVKRGRCVFALALVTPIAMAEVKGAGTSGFEVREKVHIAAEPGTVYAAGLAPKRWWDPKHTYSRDPNRVTLEARAGGCWCESLPGGGSVEHLEITYLAPGKAIRFRGAVCVVTVIGVGCCILS